MSFQYDYEIIVIDNIRGRGLTSEQRSQKQWFRDNADTVVEADEPFNWSRLNNLGASQASGEYLLFLNDDIEVIDPHWLQALMEHAQRPEVGVVGPLLLYPNGTIQQAGFYLSRTLPGIARHVFRESDQDDIGYFGLAQTQRNMIGVTGACMMVHRGTFDALGGFDEAHSVVNNDLDFCLRAHAAGKWNIYTPHTRAIHHEMASRRHLADVYDTKRFLDAWDDLFTAGDPFYNRNLSTDFDDCRFEEEPLCEIYAGNPIGDLDQIRRILVVKLDHIGDLVTSLPAFRRLKQRFPKAQVTALVAPSAVAVARLEASIDKILEFEFFEARSGLGEKVLTEKDYARLRTRLEAGHFDLAIDFRKHDETRHFLLYSGARILAGFEDAVHRFPWLHYAEEWTPDQACLRKRQHISQTLVNFVDGLANAFDTERRAILPPAGAELPPLFPALEAEFKDLFRSDYVCVHVACGNTARQWPSQHFAALIDLLVTKGGVNVAILGGSDEGDIAKAVIDKIRSPSGVYNLVGRSKLSELPWILSRSRLFIGSNSGPKHIAAGLGVPTIGVHSGVVSADEWGPLGPNAMALQKRMACTPCYFPRAEDCPRDLACLKMLQPSQVYELCNRFLMLRSAHAKELK